MDRGGRWLIGILGVLILVLVTSIVFYWKGRWDEQVAALVAGAGTFVADDKTGRVTFVYRVKQEQRP